jgi:hypothetical protein
MRLILESKNGAQVRDMQVPNGPTPRVGEVLAFPELSEHCGGLHTFLVLDVCWMMVDGQLSPEVIARATSPDENRYFRLAEAGWLPPLPQD